MERSIESRKPAQDSQGGLSKISKIYFGVDIFQVVIVAASQSAMIAIGNFNAYNNKENRGMGPGRRIYMIIFMAAVVYTCLICLFAVKKKNFMEILAFVLQNFGFVTYSCIQVYHVGFKKYQGHRLNNNMHLPKIAVTNTVVMLILNGFFIVLSYKLYIEFGWKIYKRVRFNLRLRSLYHIYQLLSCLLKMEILYWSMYAICNSEVLLKTSNKTALYYVNLTFIPLVVVYAVLGYKGTQWENRPMMITYLCWTLGGIGYFMYKLYSFTTRTCAGCPEFYEIGKDIPEEAVLHFCYLTSINLAVLAVLFAVGTKAFMNFGKGLGEHFKAKGRKEKTIDFLRVSHFIEESVISTASGDSILDDLNESMRLDKRETLFCGAFSAMAPLLAVQTTTTTKSASLPNLGGSANRRNSCPAGVRNQNAASESSCKASFTLEPSTPTKLAVITEDNEEITSRSDLQIDCERNEEANDKEAFVNCHSEHNNIEEHKDECKEIEVVNSNTDKTKVNGFNDIQRLSNKNQRVSKGLRDWIPVLGRARKKAAINDRVKDYIWKHELTEESIVKEYQNPLHNVNKNGSLAMETVTVEITNEMSKVDSRLRTASKESNF